MSVWFNPRGPSADQYTPPFGANHGWICPKCGRCYSPMTSMCGSCSWNVTVPFVPSVTNPVLPNTWTAGGHYQTGTASAGGVEPKRHDDMTGGHVEAATQVLGRINRSTGRWFPLDRPAPAADPRGDLGWLDK